MNIKKIIIEYGSIILLVILIRIFLITPIQVNETSMEATLHDKDVMILNIIGFHLSDIKRFDIVVFKYKDEELIKRVIGLPGETVEYKNNKLYINDKLVKEPFIKEKTNNYNLYKEEGIEVIPKDKYFVLGDNRDNSLDSRIFGLVDKKDVLGKTNLIIFPFNHFGLVK